MRGTTCRLEWLRTHQAISMSLSQINWQQLGSDKGRVVGGFVSQCLSAKCRVKAFAAIKTVVFWLPQETYSIATRRALSTACEECIEVPAALDGSDRGVFFLCLMTYSRLLIVSADNAECQSPAPPSRPFCVVAPSPYLS